MINAFKNDLEKGKHEVLRSQFNKDIEKKINDKEDLKSRSCFENEINKENEICFEEKHSS